MIRDQKVILMVNDKQADTNPGESEFPGKNKSAGSTSGNENYGSTKNQTAEPKTQDTEEKS